MVVGQQDDGGEKESLVKTMAERMMKQGEVLSRIKAVNQMRLTKR